MSSQRTAQWCHDASPMKRSGKHRTGFALVETQEADDVRLRPHETVAQVLCGDSGGRSIIGIRTVVADVAGRNPPRLRDRCSRRSPEATYTAAISAVDQWNRKASSQKNTASVGRVVSSRPSPTTGRSTGDPMRVSGEAPVAAEPTRTAATRRPSRRELVHPVRWTRPSPVRSTSGVMRDVPDRSLVGIRGSWRRWCSYQQQDVVDRRE